jgi:branched-chain amino acid transport system substrate-binding protein
MRHPSSDLLVRGCVAGIALAVTVGAATGCADKSASGGTSATESAQSADKAIAAAPAGTFKDDKATGEPVKLGLINPEGGAGISEPEGREGAEAVVKYANENLGGLGGRPIQLVVCKAKEDPASAIDCANQMVDAKVVGVVSSDNGQGDLMMPILTKAKIPYGSYSGASTGELTAKNYSYAWTGGYPGVLNGMAKFSAEKSIKRVALFVQDIPAVTNGAKSIGGPAFKAAGVDLKVIPVPTGNPDSTPQVSAGLKFDPQGAGIVGDSTLCTSVLKALDTLGSKAQRMTNQSCADPSVFKAAGKALEGMKVMAASDGASDDPEARAYRAILAKYAPGLSPKGFARNGYQSTLGFIRAAAGVKGQVTAESVNAAIRAAKNVPVPIGHGATMTCDGKAYPNMPMICNGSNVVQTVEGSGISASELIK